MDSETFKGRPRLLSYPSPPDREILATFKKPKKENVLSRFCKCSQTRPIDIGDNKTESVHSHDERR